MTVRATDPGTSRAAAAGAPSNRVEQVFEVLLEAGRPLTDEQIHEACVLKFRSMTSTSARHGRLGLQRQGLVTAMGHGESRTGRRSIRWGLTTGAQPKHLFEDRPKTTAEASSREASLCGAIRAIAAAVREASNYAHTPLKVRQAVSAAERLAGSNR